MPRPPLPSFTMMIGLSAAIGRLAPGTATALFIAYAALNGLTLSVDQVRT